MAFVPQTSLNFRPTSYLALNRSSFVTSRSRPPASAAPSFEWKTPKKISPICSDMGISFPEKKFDEQLRIGVISTRWNQQYVSALTDTVKSTLVAKGIPESDIVQMMVPGAWELPVAARLMCASQKVDAVVCLGTLIKGETEHYEYIAGPVSSGLMDLQLTLSTPMIFGVLCCTTKEQAEKRSIGDGSHAEEWALTALEMAQLKKSQLGGVSAGKKSVGFF